MTSWITDIYYCESLPLFEAYCAKKYVSLDTEFHRLFNEGKLNNYEYKLCIIWGNDGTYETRRLYEWDTTNWI